MPPELQAETAAQEQPAQPYKRVLQPEARSPKLHKVLAQAGLGSRLEMERFIAEGRLTVNNAAAHVGQRVQVGDMIKLDGKPVRVRIEQPTVRVLAYHKPAGEVVTHDDPQNRPTVFRRLPYLAQGKWQSVGRLDLNTEGLLLLTNSGDLANRLMHPSFGLEREYAVRVLGALTPEEKQQLLDGVMLDDGPAAFGSIDDGGGEGANVWYRVTISEGRNREVRRIFESLGRAVSRLIRIRYGAMQLPRGLRRGAWTELDERDIQALALASGAGKALLRKKPQAQPNVRRESDRAGSRKKTRVERGRRSTANCILTAARANRAAPAPRARQKLPPNALVKTVCCAPAWHKSANRALPSAGAECFSPPWLAARPAGAALRWPRFSGIGGRLRPPGGAAGPAPPWLPRSLLCYRSRSACRCTGRRRQPHAPSGGRWHR